MQVNGVSSAGFSLVNREIQQSLAKVNAVAAAQRERSLESAAKQAEDAETRAAQQRNRQNLAIQVQPSSDSRRVDVYL